MRLEGPPTTPKFDMNAPSVGLSFAVPDCVLFGYEPELFGQFPGRKTSENAMRLPEAQGSGVGEGCSKALADLKAGSTGRPDRLLVATSLPQCCPYVARQLSVQFGTGDTGISSCRATQIFTWSGVGLEASDACSG